MHISKSKVGMIELPEPDDTNGVMSFIESIGRTCYKSNDKITPDSNVKFIQNLFKNGHTSVLEHYIFVMEVNRVIYNAFMNRAWGLDRYYDVYEMLHYIRCSEFIDSKTYEMRYILSGSATAFNKIFKAAVNTVPFSDFNSEAFHTTEYSQWVDRVFSSPDFSYNSLIGFNDAYALYSVQKFLFGYYPDMIEYDARLDKYITPCESAIRFLSREEVKNLPYRVRMLHDSMSAKFVTDRAICMEIVRHRAASYSMESTRYCNYSSNKFGSSINVIEPPFFTEEESLSKHTRWKFACQAAEQSYIDLVNDDGATPQEARAVLPQSTKAELIMTARLNEWRHFFEMRTDKASHPQIRALAYNLLHDFLHAQESGFYAAWADLIMKG